MALIGRYLRVKTKQRPMKDVLRWSVKLRHQNDGDDRILLYKVDAGYSWYVLGVKSGFGAF